VAKQTVRGIVYQAWQRCRNDRLGYRSAYSGLRRFLMRFLIVFVVTGLLLLAPVNLAADSARVIAATATSSSPGAASVVCLLNAGCTGSWSPGSLDSGSNEGLYVQFETTVDADTIELITTLRDAARNFSVSVNGSLVSGSPKTRPTEDNQYIVRYAVPTGHIKSLYFRLGVLKGGWKGFALSAVRFYEKGSRVDLKLPVLVPASVTATSILEPKVAYQPANLFDSRYDFAWSTNGQTTSGKGESIEVKFDQPQDLSGVIIWNGYQRSEEHFKSNGRVARMTATAGPISNSFTLDDKMGSQQVTFPQPMKDASSVKLTIDYIKAGTKYRDVLISELRFVDGHGQVLISQVKGIVPEASPKTAELTDRSLSSVACALAVGEADPEAVFQRTLRLRRDGSFVIYSNDFIYEDRRTKNSDQVLEGNWELRGSEVRIFGKRYADTVVTADYSLAAQKIPPSIFQSDLKIARFHDLMRDEKEQLASLVVSRIGRDVKGNGNDALTVYGVGDAVLARGMGKKELVANLVNSLDAMNPWALKSPILADAMLPSDETGHCGGSN